MATGNAVQSFNKAVSGADDLCRLHLSENHYGIAPHVRAVVEEELTRIHYYPDPECGDLREAIAAHHGVTKDMVVVGNGTDEILLMIALAFLGGGDKVGLTSASTFPGYQVTTALVGGTPRHVPMQGYRNDASALAAACGPDVTAVFLCNPHNPTGTALTESELRQLLDAAEATGVLPIIDEAYAEFSDQPFASVIPSIREGGRALVMRTFSKSHGLAGFRVGYAVGSPELIAELLRIRSALPFSVNRLALAAAGAALRHPEFVDEVRANTQQVKAYFYEEMDRLGIEYIRSQTNFVLIRVPGDSGEWSRRLVEEHGILSRDTTAFGYPGHIRLSMGDRVRTEQAVHALSQLKAGE